MPSREIGLRGGAKLEFRVKTANIDAHSVEFGGKTPNALMILSQIIASFYIKEGNVAVEGLYGNVLPMSPLEREMVKKVPYDPASDMKILGTNAEAGGTNYSSLERVWYRPTLEIIVMQGGYVAAEGFSNIIPGSAMARVSCRLINNQTGDEIIDKVVMHINKYCPPGATIEYTIKPAYLRPVKFPADTKEYKSIADALTKMYGRPPQQIASSASVGPLIEVKEQLGHYAYSLGVQQSDKNGMRQMSFTIVQYSKRTIGLLLLFAAYCR